MSKLATELSTKIGNQVGNINWTVTSPLAYGRRHICVDIKTLCKSCGAPTHIFYVYDDLRYEPLCHDCAWPKNREYLRKKEEKRQKESIIKEMS